jgi:hypothetical protein
MPISPSLARFDARIISHLLIYILSLMGMGSHQENADYNDKETPILKNPNFSVNLYRTIVRIMRFLQIVYYNLIMLLDRLNPIDI